MPYKRLGDLLLSVGLITEKQLKYALQQQKMTKNRLGQELIVEKAITEEQMLEALQQQLGIDFIDLSTLDISPKLAKLLPQNIAKKYDIVPVRLNNETLYIAMNDPLNFMAIEEVKTATRKRVVPLITTAEGVKRAISRLYGNEGANRAIEEMRWEMEVSGKSESRTDSFSASTIGGNATSAPAVRLVNSIIERAITDRASDIHIEPFEHEIRVRMRIDGMMHHTMTVPKDLQASLISRLKIMGNMDITERRIPQDGRAAVRLKQHNVDLRLSTLPTIYGEKFVVRLLEKNARFSSPESIGLRDDNLKKFLSLLHDSANGVVLIAGPTGSGKSSTMYTMIRELNTESVNLVTLEDPVEYNMEGINQVQINEKVGMTFSSGLRSILRQDPDIISVGEIRDGETAEIVMRAAITGHLVLSTIHTNNALATIDRLIDIGVEPYLIANALNGVISQRLVRRLCPHCRQAYTPDIDKLAALGMPLDSNAQFYRAAGCPSCMNTGYIGRIGVFEILTLNRTFRHAITRGTGGAELASLVQHNNRFTTLTANCRRLVQEGITTITEVQRVTNSADYKYEN